MGKAIVIENTTPVIGKCATPRLTVTAESSCPGDSACGSGDCGCDGDCMDCYYDK